MKPAFFRDTMIIFAVDILVQTVLCLLFGEDAQEISTLFQLGSKGLAVETVFQHLLCAAVVAGWMQIFISEKIFKHMMVLWRTIGMLFAVIVSVAGFILGFGWFPADNVRGWIGFLISFFLCFGLSMGVMILKTNRQSRKYEKLLKKYQNSEETKKEQEKQGQEREKGV